MPKRLYPYGTIIAKVERLLPVAGG